MEWFSGLSDDQKAIVGCLVALVACGAMMSLTSFLTRNAKTADRSEEGRTTSIRAARAVAHPESAEQQPRRKAA